MGVQDLNTQTARYVEDQKRKVSQRDATTFKRLCSTPGTEQGEYFYSCFTDEETEAKRLLLICLKSYN